jgi:hypothetical protein
MRHVINSRNNQKIKMRTKHQIIYIRTTKGEELGHESNHKGRSWGGQQATLAMRTWCVWCGCSQATGWPARPLQAIWGGWRRTPNMARVAGKPPHGWLGQSRATPPGRQRQMQKRVAFSGSGVRQRWTTGQCGRNNIVFCSHFEFVC